MNTVTNSELVRQFSVLIEKKVSGEELTESEIREITNAIVSKKIPEYQLSAFLMAVYFKDMTIPEAAIWTEEMMLSGDIIDTSKVSWPKIDRCATGGVGDKSAFGVLK